MSEWYDECGKSLHAEYTAKDALMNKCYALYKKQKFATLCEGDIVEVSTYEFMVRYFEYTKYLSWQYLARHSTSVLRPRQRRRGRESLQRTSTTRSLRKLCVLLLTLLGRVVPCKILNRVCCILAKYPSTPKQKHAP